MDGLTNIIAKINQEAKNECDAISESAQKQALDILETAKLEAAKLQAQILEDADLKKKAILSRGESTSLVEYKRVLLSKKSEILALAVENAKKNILDMNDADYFDFIKKLIVKEALCGDGKIFFSKTDLKRIPDGFEKEISDLGGGKRLSLSKDSVNIDGGFVIEYDEMSVDCSLSSVIDDKIDVIRDNLSGELFA